MRINLAGDAVEKWSCNFRRENRNICISTPDSRAKKDLWGSPTPRGLNPRVLDPFTFLLVFSRDEWENRQNWYGVPIKVRSPAIKKKQRSHPLPS